MATRQAPVNYEVIPDLPYHEAGQQGRARALTTRTRSAAVRGVGEVIVLNFSCHEIK